MQYRHLFPMVRILLPFMAGIIVCLSLSSTEIIPFTIWISLLLLSLGAGFIPAITKRKSLNWLFGLVLSFFLFVSGYNAVIFQKEILGPDHFAQKQIQGSFIARVSEPLQEKDHSYKTILSIEGIRKGNDIIEAKGSILTYFAKDSLIKPPTNGSLIAITGTIQEISPAQNPGSFDYRKYMASNNVYHQVFLKNYAWKTLEEPQGFNIYRFSHQLSQKFISILNANGLKDKEFAVASALLLGQKDMLDNETRQAYSGSGVMHILCVSGLHVGVIYFIISFALGFMKKSGKQLFFKTALILLTIWAYAVLTGLSPSVLRAAIMFTFISIGNATRRHVHIINSLSVSAMALLVINPLIIMNIGFQLSYIAIIGIIFINKPIVDLWQPKNRILDYIWGLIAVSIAAQAATGPLAMYYFHQFPTYFIAGNLAAIPLSFMAIYSGVAVLITSFVPVISNFFGLITNYILFALNFIIGSIEDLPNSVLHIHSVFRTDTLLIYLILTAIMMLIYFKRKEFIYIILALVLLLSANLSYTSISRQRQQKIVFYSVNKQSAIGFINGKNQSVIANQTLLNDSQATKFQLDGAKSLYGISNMFTSAIETNADPRQGNPIQVTSLNNIGNNFLFHDKRVILIDSIPMLKRDFTKLKVDYLVIRDNPKLRIAELLKIYEPRMIIIDGSNSVYRADKWVAECKAAGVESYSLKDQGAHVVDL
jgi:competence protein ComEC